MSDDPMNMLDVIEESRQLALARQEAAVTLMKSQALQAVLAGEDPREVARKCGFDPDSKPKQAGVYTVVDEDGDEVGTIDRSMGMFGWGGTSSPNSGMKAFAQWLGEYVQEVVLQKL